MLAYHLHAQRLDAHGSLITAKDARLVADTDPAGRRDALNPAELLLADGHRSGLPEHRAVTQHLPDWHFDTRAAAHALHAVVQSNGRGLGRAPVAGQLANLFNRHTAHLGRAFG